MAFKITLLLFLIDNNFVKILKIINYHIITTNN